VPKVTNVRGVVGIGIRGDVVDTRKGEMLLQRAIVSKPGQRP